LLLFATACRSSSPLPHSPSTGEGEAEAPLQVGFVVLDGVYNTELTAPYDIFQHTLFHVTPGMRVFTVAPDLEPVRTFEGLVLQPEFSFENAPPIDVLVVPSAEHNMDTDLENEHLLEFVQERGRSASHVMSLCDGAFILAGAGLLGGRHVTTFPSDRARLQEMFADLRVHSDATLVRDGKFITSVGGAPSFDAALYLTELLYGAEKARGIARGLVIDWDLSGVALLEYD
jgi:transcriptional regulator GlxA family with amidase domain